MKASPPPTRTNSTATCHIRPPVTCLHCCVNCGLLAGTHSGKVPPPPLQTPTPCNPPPPPGRPSLPCFSSEHVLCWFVLPICFTHGLALLSHYFKSSTCVCSVIFSLQRRCMGVLCCYFRPKMFSPGDHVQYNSRTLGAHVLATVVGPSPNRPQFCHIQYIRPGGVTVVDHESAQLSRG